MSGLRLICLASLLAACGSVNSINDQNVDGGGDGDGDGDGDASIDAPPADANIEPAHTVFVSSVTFSGDQNGIDGFAAQCQTLAESAGLEGEFVPLLHTRSTPLDNDVIAIQGPVFNTGGELVALDTDEFYSGTLRASNRFTESGGEPADTVSWIGVPEPNAVFDSIAVCGDWGSTASDGGQVLVTGTSWLTANATNACTIPRSVQCISL